MKWREHIEGNMRRIGLRKEEAAGQCQNFANFQTQSCIFSAINIYAIDQFKKYVFFISDFLPISDAEKQPELATGFSFLHLCCWLKNLLTPVILLYQDIFVCIGPFGPQKKNYK